MDESERPPPPSPEHREVEFLRFLEITKACSINNQYSSHETIRGGPGLEIWELPSGILRRQKPNLVASTNRISRQ
jgi:hypothetical protein